jgi:hypothetical protein
MYQRKSPIGLGIFLSEGRHVLMGFPSALITDRFWESGHEFKSYLEQEGLGLGIEQRTTETGYYALGEEDALHAFFDEIENHFLDTEI